MSLTLSSTRGISSNGTNWAFVPNKNGSISFPNRPMFYAYNPAGVFSSTVGFIFEFNQTRVNVGNHYNTSTYKFTAPQNGVYEFFGGALFRYRGSASNGEVAFYVNNTNVGVRGQAYCVNNTSGGHTHNHVTMLLNLVTGDSVDFRIWSRNAGCDYYYGQNLGYFSGIQRG